MAALTLAQAAEATGVNRSTILRSIKSGKVSGTKDDQGTWFVEPVELFRVFKPVTPAAETAPSAVPEHAPPDVELRVRLAQAEAQLDAMKTMLADAQAQ
jgi:hypothetical protein